jgi:DNA-binding MarR family transcriptional regulator
MGGHSDGQTTSSGEADTAIATPEALLAVPGYAARRLYQAYLAAWVRTVDSLLTGPQFAVLTAVDIYPGVDQGSLASSVALDRSTMADIARRLEDRGLLIRQTAEHDGRRKLLYLSKEGVRTLREVDKRAKQLDAKLLAGYPAADRKRLVAELTKLAAHWESITAE